MNWLAAIGIISSVALLLPVIIIIIFGFLRYKNYQALLMYNYIWTTGVVMFRSQAFKDSSGFERSFFTAEDWDLYLRIARNQPVLCHDKVVV